MHLASLAEFPSWLARIAGALAGQATTALAPGKFALVEHVWHLAELEREGFAVRLSRLQTEEEPELPDFDGDRLARERAYLSRSVEAGLAAFTRARAQTVRALAQVRGAQALRSGWQEGVGRVVLHELPGRIAAHDRAHALELSALLRRLSPGSSLRAPLRRWIASLPRPLRAPCGNGSRAGGRARPTRALVSQVQRAVVERLPEGCANLRDVSSAVGLRPRSLQRRLGALGLSLQCLIDEARMAIALEGLCAGVPLVRLAMDTGYSDRRALLRAVKRWTLVTPSAARAGCAEP
jgi:AraC-like DNA-binding protein